MRISFRCKPAVILTIETGSHHVRFSRDGRKNLKPRRLGILRLPPDTQNRVSGTPDAAQNDRYVPGLHREEYFDLDKQRSQHQRHRCQQFDKHMQ